MIIFPARLTGMRLAVSKQNAYGDIQYVEVPGADGPFPDLPRDKVWAIKTPSVAAVQHYGDAAVLRSFHGVEFLVSAAADAKVKMPSSVPGATCIVEVSHPGGRFFVMVTDNKPYVQHPQGQSEPGDETSASAAVRELREEVGLHVSPEELRLVAKWSFQWRNALVDGEADACTDCFHVSVAYERVQHLFPQGVSPDQVTVVANPDVLAQLDEVESVLAIPAAIVEGLGNRLAGKDFGGHHRACLHILLRLPLVPVTYLKSFVWCGWQTNK